MWCAASLPNRHRALAEAQRKKLLEGPGLDTFLPQGGRIIISLAIKSPHSGGCGAGAAPAEEADDDSNDAPTKRFAKVPGFRKVMQHRERLPKWLQTQIPVGPAFNKIRGSLRDLKLHTARG